VSGAVVQGRPVAWKPNPGPQERFLSSGAYEALYGGAAGGGKTEALVMGVLRWLEEATFRALILRRTYPELVRDIIPLSWEHYPNHGGRYNKSEKTWRFPSGAAVEFGHVEHEDDVHGYQGLEAQYLAFDELTSFTEKQYLYLTSRLRSSKGIPVRIRSATNPGGVGHEWVFKRWSPWLDPSSEVKAEPGQVLYYRNTDAGAEWCERGVGTLGRVFVPAKIADNPHIADNDPDYANRLRGLDRVTRGQLLDGNWLIKPAAGLYFQRGWFKWLDVAPADVLGRVRRWDLASTEDGDWTVGVRMSRPKDSGLWVIEDVIRVRMRPEGVERAILATAETDPRGTRIVLPQDPGQAGKAQADSYAQKLSRYDIRFERETGDKVTRAQPFSAQCEAGNVAIVRGCPNVEPFLQALEAFPDEGVHDDDVDAASGAYVALQDLTTMGAYIQAIKKASSK
jgi:predicted phage terminase large subunit-like protein